MRRAALAFFVISVGLVVAGGAALALTVTQCAQNVACEGTAGPDLLKGSDGNDRMYGHERADVLRGRDGNDFLEGQQGRDELFGGSSRDYLEGGPGTDVLRGGDGDRYDLYAAGWGHDTMVDTVIDDSDINSGNWLWISLPSSATEELTIGLASGPGPELSTENGGDTLDWEGDVVDSVFASNPGNDLIEGNGRANMLAGFGRTDTLHGGGGNDSSAWTTERVGTSWSAARASTASTGTLRTPTRGQPATGCPTTARTNWTPSSTVRMGERRRHCLKAGSARQW